MDGAKVNRQGSIVARAALGACHLPLTRGDTVHEEPVKIQDVMTRDPRCLTPEASAREAARMMRDENVGVIPVVEGKGSNKLVGVVTDRDLAVRIVAEGRDAETRVRDVMSAGLHTCGPDEDIDTVMETMSTEQVRRIPIVDERGSLVGIVAQADVVRKVKDDRKAEQTVEDISQPGGRHSQ
jgi:CBS domain-containing protein